MKIAEYRQLVGSIEEFIASHPDDASAYSDLFDVCRDIYENEQRKKYGRQINEKIRTAASEKVAQGINVGRFYEIYRRSLLLDAPDIFDCYALYLEIDRKPEERFYQNRRKIMKRVADALQKLADDELDELFLSMPPRVGKTTLVMFYVSWLMGRKTEKPSLYCSYTNVITNAFYNGILEIMQDKDTYRYADVFPRAAIVRTNAQEETIDVGRRKHYPTLTCRSLYGTLNGACDAEGGIIVADDLIGGIEEALSTERLTSAWSKVDNNLIPRGKSTTKYLWMGTRWSVIDPPGIRLEMIENDAAFESRRYEQINLPALNENDESNFDYDYKVGFSTEDFKQRRASFERRGDTASWMAQYMGTPIERDGTLFSPTELRYYNGELPDTAPDRIFMAVDPAFGGGDYVAAPVCVEYGDDIFVVDAVYSNEDKRVTQPLIVNAIEKYGVTMAQIEANKSTESYKTEIEQMLRSRNIRINLTSRAAPPTKSKSQRIFDKAADIKERMIFLESGKRSKMYSGFMQNVYGFKMYASKQHDDAPDVLAQAMSLVTMPTRRIEFFRRPF